MRYKILTFGCQMNKSDSERIGGLLLDMGMKEAGRAEEADLIILNTCSVRQSAEDRIYGAVRNFNRLKKQNPRLLIAVTGCMAGRDKDGAIRKKVSKEGKKDMLADFFFPISDLPRLPEMIFSRWNEYSPSGSASWRRSRGVTLRNFNPSTSSGSKISMDYLGVKPKAAERWRGWAVIQTGCSNYCTYCVVPFSRGREKNRPMKAILKEVRELVNGGAKEINLLGQAVNGWRAPDPHNFSKNNPFCQKKCLAEFGAVAPNSADSKIAKITKPLTVANDFVIDKSNGIDKKNDFEALLWEVNRIEGINRVGFYSAHPMYMNDATIKALKLPKMMNYLHLPVQSGNNEILKKMNRNYTREEYLKVIHRVKKARPELALATDIIVGFPGETKRQFADTVSLYKKCDFDMSYNAMYSPRTGTAAFGAFPDDVPQEEKRRRWRVLQNLMEKNVLRKNKKFLKKTVEVLVDGCRPAAHGSGGVNWGFSREYKKVSFSGNPDLIGQVVNVKINKVQEWELEGIIAN